MTIKTDRLNIYPVSDEEMEKIIAAQTRPELKAAYEEMLGGCLAYPEKRIWYTLWNIELNDGSETIVGNLSFKGLGDDGVLEIGYGTNDDFEGRGYMTEAVTAVVKWAAAQDGVKLIEAETEEDNVASKKVLQKSGFIPDGTIGDEGPRFVFIKQ